MPVATFTARPSATKARSAVWTVPRTSGVENGSMQTCPERTILYDGPVKRLPRLRQHLQHRVGRRDHRHRASANRSTWSGSIDRERQCPRRDDQLVHAEARERAARSRTCSIEPLEGVGAPGLPGLLAHRVGRKRGTSPARTPRGRRPRCAPRSRTGRATGRTSTGRARPRRRRGERPRASPRRPPASSATPRSNRWPRARRRAADAGRPCPRATAGSASAPAAASDDPREATTSSPRGSAGPFRRRVPRRSTPRPRAPRSAPPSCRTGSRRPRTPARASRRPGRPRPGRPRAGRSWLPPSRPSRGAETPRTARARPDARGRSRSRDPPSPSTARARRSARRCRRSARTNREMVGEPDAVEAERPRPGGPTTPSRQRRWCPRAARIRTGGSPSRRAWQQDTAGAAPLRGRRRDRRLGDERAAEQRTAVVAANDHVDEPPEPGRHGLCEGGAAGGIETPDRRRGRLSCPLVR